MKKRTLKNALCVFLTILMFLSSAILTIAAQEDTGSVNANSVLQNNKVVCVSKYGNTVNYPENSVEGIASAAEMGADMIMVSVKKTSDNTIVLMTDENLSRMCVDAQNNTVDKNVSDIGYYELATFHLRNSTGLSHEKITAYTVPTLQETVEKLNGKAVLVINDGWQFRDDIYQILSDMNSLDSAVIVADGKKKEVSQWLLGKTSMPLVFSKYEGNVIWNSSAYIKKTVNAGVAGVILCDNNSYSTSFSTSVVSKVSGKARAVVDMTDPKLCGNRQDSNIGWDDVTSRGFSVIITNNIEQLCQYRQRVDSANEKLNNLISKVMSIDTTSCSTVSVNALNEAFYKAKDASGSPSAMVLEESFCNLQNAVSALTDRNANDNGSTTITKGRIIAAICVVAGLVIMEIVFDYFRRKKVAARKLGKKKKVKKNRDEISFD